MAISLARALTEAAAKGVVVPRDAQMLPHLFQRQPAQTNAGGRLRIWCTIIPIFQAFLFRLPTVCPRYTPSYCLDLAQPLGLLRTNPARSAVLQPT